MRRIAAMLVLGALTAGLGCDSDHPPTPQRAQLVAAPQNGIADPRPLPQVQPPAQPAPGEQRDAPVWPVKPAGEVNVPTPPTQPVPDAAKDQSPIPPPSGTSDGLPLSKGAANLQIPQTEVSVPNSTK